MDERCHQRFTNSLYSHTPTYTLLTTGLALFYNGQHYLFSHQNDIREKRLAFPSGHGFLNQGNNTITT